MNFLLYLVITLFILVAVILIMLVLIQKGKGGGLASAFGGMGGNTAFGAKTGDVLTIATSVVFFIFMVLAIILNLMVNKPAPAPAALAPVTALPQSTPAQTTMPSSTAATQPTSPEAP